MLILPPLLLPTLLVLLLLYCRDHSEGSDTWAVNRGYVSVTPLSLRSDVPLRLVSCEA